TRIYMPTCITRIRVCRETYRKRSKPMHRHPAIRTDQLVVCAQQLRRISGTYERSVVIAAEPHHGALPSFGINLAAIHVSPKYLSALICQFFGEGAINADILVGNKLLNLLTVKHRFLFLKYSV